VKRLRVVLDGGPVEEPFEAVVLEDHELAEIVRMKAALRTISQAADGTPIADLATIAREALPR